jgi:hypothetical protein
MTYTGQTTPDTSRTKCVLKATEMRILRRISEKILLGKVRGRPCKVKDINKWVHQ